MIFDSLAKNYNDTCDNAVRLSGYGWEYFARYKTKCLSEILPPKFAGKILDFGCGVGNLLQVLHQSYPSARLHGYDVSLESLKFIDPAFSSHVHTTHDFASLPSDYDLIIASNVFHHIAPNERRRTIAALHNKLRASGKLVIFEHNPLNPLTQWSVRHSPLDRDAHMVGPRTLTGMLRDLGFHSLDTKYIVFFPKLLSFLHPAEAYLRWLPLGAQYFLRGSK